MLKDTLDYQLQAATCARAYLERLLRHLREDTIAAWLRENRKHVKASPVDSELTLYRLNGDEEHLDYAEALIERYATE